MSRVRLSLLVSALLLLSAIAAACGDDGGGDEALRTYFRETALVINDLDDRSEQSVVNSPDDVLSVWALIARDTAQDLFAIDPPEDLVEQHEALAEAIDYIGVRLGNLAVENTGLGSPEEALLIRNRDEEIVEADGRARAVCSELRLVAEDNGIAVNLELCPPAPSPDDPPPPTEEPEPTDESTPPAVMLHGAAQPFL